MLLAAPWPEAFDIAAGVRNHPTGTTMTGALSENGDHRVPFGIEMVYEWVVRHPNPGYRLLADRAAAGDPIGGDALRALHRIDPYGTAAWLRRPDLGLVEPPLPRPYGRCSTRRRVSTPARARRCPWWSSTTPSAT